METSTWTEASIWIVVMLRTTSIGLHMNTGTKHVRNQINHTLVDSHLQMLPGVGTFSARRLAGSDTEVLGRHTDGASHLHLLVGSNALDISTHYTISTSTPKATHLSRQP